MSKHVWHVFCVAVFPAFLVASLIIWIEFGIKEKKRFMEVVNIGWKVFGS